MRKTLSFNQYFWDKLKQKASEKGMKISEYIRYILNKIWDEEM